MPFLNTRHLFAAARHSLKVNGLPHKSTPLAGTCVVVLIPTRNPHLRKFVCTRDQPRSYFDHGRFTVRDLQGNLLTCEIERQPSSPSRRKADRLATTLLALGSLKRARRNEQITLP